MRSLLLAAAFALFAMPASAQPSGVVGTWLTGSGVGQVKVGPSPHAATSVICGTSRKVIGMPLIWGFKATSDPGTFESGRIYNGENGKTYSANISLQADGKLRLRGYVGSPMLGETQPWTRVSQ
jgi:uncharacterized protein (DUF2147 family)